MTLEPGHLISIAVFVLGSFGAIAKLLLMSVEKSLDGRFAQITERFSQIDAQLAQERDGWRKVERDLLQFRADMPMQYVRREDYIRNQTIIEAKLDAIASELKLVQITGAKRAS